MKSCLCILDLSDTYRWHLNSALQYVFYSEVHRSGIPQVLEDDICGNVRENRLDLASLWMK